MGPLSCSFYTDHVRDLSMLIETEKIRIHPFFKETSLQEISANQKLKGLVNLFK